MADVIVSEAPTGLQTLRQYHVEALAVARRLDRLLGKLCEDGYAGPIERAWDHVDEALSLLQGDTGTLPQLPCVAKRNPTGAGRPLKVEQRRQLVWLVAERGMPVKDAAALLGVTPVAAYRMLQRIRAAARALAQEVRHG